MSTAPTAHRGSSRLPTPEEVAVLDLISEQGAIQTDQLSKFLGINQPEANKLAKELAEIGCVEFRRLVEGDEPWVWLNSHGALHSNTGFAAITPALNRLAHIRAINQARLRFAKVQPGGKWICERQLRREARPRHRRGRDELIPDAAFEIENKEGVLERWAIEVELTPKTAERFEAIIADHCIRYDVVFYLCSREVARYMGRLGLERRFSNLAVVNLYSPKERWKGAGPPKRSKRGEPRPDDIPILDLISEQGAIPIDQLARFLGYKLDKAKRTVKRLQEAGLVRRERPLANEPEWIWLSKRGARFSTMRLSAPRPKPGSLARMRATNEVRIGITQANPGIGWVSRRVLLRKLGRNATAPRAVVEIGDERHAIEIRLTPGLETNLERQIRQRLTDYDAVVFFCAPKARAQMKRLVERYGWPNVVVRGLSRG
jgi:predicted transcriptional regulator